MIDLTRAYISDDDIISIHDTWLKCDKNYIMTQNQLGKQIPRLTLMDIKVSLMRYFERKD